MQLNIPISKVDEEKRMVYGYATAEVLDSQGDIVDYKASKKAFGEWAGNIREMHDETRAVGKAIEISYDDKDKKVLVGAKISESADGENAWVKVKEGVLAGFSIGGKVNKTVRETVKSKTGDDTPATRILDYTLGELSLVDNPACPLATLVMVKSIGGKLQRVEEPERASNPYPVAWWVNKYNQPVIENDVIADNNNMSKKEVKKDMYAAGFLLDLALDLQSYISGEQYEGENVDELNAALITIKNAIVDELTEPVTSADDVADSMLTNAVEMASKVIDLKKGDKKVATEKKEIEKTEGAEETKVVKSKKEEVEKNVIGGVERDENGEVKEDDSPAEGESAEGAVTATETTPVSDDEVGAEADEVDETTEDEADGKTKVDVKAGKSTKPQGLEKSVNSLLKKLDAMGDLQKSVGELSSKVEQLSALEDRIGKLEELPAASKIKASYHDVSKSDEKVDSEQADVQKLQERQAELMADPQAGTPQERNDIFQELYRANQKGLLQEKENNKE